MFKSTENAADQIAKLRSDEKELRDKDARISKALSRSLKRAIQEHNALMEKL